MSSRVSIVAAFLFCLSNSALAGTWYVNGAAAAGGNGQSWASAYQRVQDALAVAQSGDQVWVAQGTYLPGDVSSPRTVTFQLPLGVRTYGGFAGGETLLSQRDWAAHETILSGDLHQDDLPGFVNRSDNCYHVVTIAGLGPTAALDGFTLRGGNADGSGPAAMGGGVYLASTTSSGGPAFANLRFVDNSAVEYGGGVGSNGNVNFTDSLFEGNHAGNGGGGGLYTNHAMTLVRCVLRSNDTAAVGGATFIDYAGGEFLNCILAGNHAGFAGGIYGIGFFIYMRNCTVTGNHATDYGGAEIDGGGLLLAYDSIFWGNTDTTHTGLYEQQVYDGALDSHFSAFQGSSPPWNQDPLWVDPLGPDGIAGTADDDLRLSCLSPYIDAGLNSGAATGSTDLAGNPRRVDDPAIPDTGSGGAPVVDLGPYEFSCGCAGALNYCSALPNSSGAAASIGWSGSTSLFANSLTLSASGAPPLKNGLFFYGSAQANVPWGDGLRCVGGSLQRLAVLQTDASGAAPFALDFTQFPLSSGAHALLAGSTWNFQFYFRDPLGGPAGWNSSDALEVSFCP
jgi:hypothetical protein